MNRTYIWHDAPLSQITEMCPTCQSSAQLPFCFSLPPLGNRAPDILPDVSHMKASPFSPLSVLSSAGAWHARIKTTFAQISAACPLPPQTRHSCPGHRTALSNVTATLALHAVVLWAITLVTIARLFLPFPTTTPIPPSPHSSSASTKTWRLFFSFPASAMQA